MSDELSRVTRERDLYWQLLELGLRDDGDPTRPYRTSLRVEGVVGSSDAIASVLKRVSLVAGLEVAVLLTGAPGTGKTQLARVIHDNGSRASAPFVTLDCAALAEDLIEPELFGANPVVRSDAQGRTRGKVEIAHGGTLFLDQVCALPLRQQAKVLQLLQWGTYTPLGETRPRKSNVRVIAATNTDLESAVAGQRFREDLYCRLNVCHVRLPALSERRSDIAALARHFCKTSAEANGFPAPELSLDAQCALEHAELPGNVSELAYLVEVAAMRAHADGSTTIERAHVFPAQERRVEPTTTFHEATRKFQRTLLSETLAREAWNVTAAARALDLTRAHVYNLMATLGIQRPSEANER